MKTINEFKSFFEQDMLADLEMLDWRRRQVLRRSFRVVLYTVLALVLLIVIYNMLPDGSSENTTTVLVVIGVAILVAAAVFGVKWARDKTFYADFKTQVIERIVKFISPDLVYEPKNHVGSDSFERSRIFLKTVDRFSGDDMVRGKIDKTQIWFSEVKAEYKTTTTDSKGNRKTTWHTIFKGLFFIADFNKHFQTSTVVLPNRLGKSALAGFFNKMNLARKEKLVKMEDPDFNKHFVVYGEDQIEARYVLSTALLKRITDFREKHPNALYLSFVNSFLYVAIAYTKDLFEPSYFKKLTNFDLVKTFYEEIHLAVNIVEELNLNNRIWTKE
jgi:predicted membrane channel-forming protein YqfA (hemolysin III family)